MFSTQKMKRLLLFLVACLSTQAAQAQAGIVAGQTVGMQLRYPTNATFYCTFQTVLQCNTLDADGDGTNDFSLICDAGGIYTLQMTSLQPTVWEILQHNTSVNGYMMPVPLASPIGPVSGTSLWAVGTGYLLNAGPSSQSNNATMRGNWRPDTLTRIIGIRQLRNGQWRYGYLKTKYPTPGWSSYLRVTVCAMQSVATGVSQQQLTGIEVYPNPVADQLQIVIPERTVAQVEIKDLTGRVQLCQALPPGSLTHSLSLAGLSAGTYLVRLHTAGGTLTRRISKL